MNECPTRILSADAEPDLLLQWFMATAAFGGMTAAPTGPPEWPHPGGYWAQPAALVDAAAILKGELAFVTGARSEEKKAARRPTKR